MLAIMLTCSKVGLRQD